MVKKALIFIGAPGCGKGTQSSFVIKNFGFNSISVGEILRDEISSCSKFGKEIEEFYSSGKLFPDSIIIKVVENIMTKIKSDKLLFDGFPRTIGQAEALDKMFSEKFHGIKVFALYFKVEDEIVCRRLLSRFSCKNCGAVYNEITKKPKKEGICDECLNDVFIKRTDDEKEKIIVRLNDYKNLTLPVIDFYNKNNILKELNASFEVQVVTDEIKEKLNDFLFD